MVTRKTHFFLVAIDEDPIPGGMHGDRIAEDVTYMIQHAFISAYNPQVHHLGSTTRESNFSKNVDLPIGIRLVRPEEVIHSGGINIAYKAERHPE